MRFDRIRAITRLTYLPGGQNGRLNAGEIYTSLDGQEWTLVKSFSGLANDASLKTIDLDKPVLARYLKLVATATYYNTAGEKDRYFSGKMLNFYQDPNLAEELPVEVVYTPQDPTRENVTATLVLPDDCKADVTQYLFEDNGTHTFTYYNSKGREQTIDASVDWIDREAPVGTVVYSPDSWTSGPVTATVQTNEDVVFTDGSEGTHTFDTNEGYTFQFEDAAGNTAQLEATVSWIDKTKPAEEELVTVEKDEDSGTITLNLNPYAVKLLGVNGTDSTDNPLTVTQNGLYTFRLQLLETGYTFDYTVRVDWLTGPAPEPAPTPNSEPASTPAPTPQPTATPAPAATATPAPQVETVQGAAPTATKAPTGTRPSVSVGGSAATPTPLPTATPSSTPTATPAPAETPVPTLTPEPAAAEETASPHWLLIVAGIGAAVGIAGLLFALLPRGRKRRR